MTEPQPSLHPEHDSIVEAAKMHATYYRQSRMVNLCISPAPVLPGDEAADLCFDPMAWTTPQYSREEINRAGAAYVSANGNREQRELARVVINNWRSSHSFPLNTLQVNLRGRASSFDDDPTIAQRIKRLPSIQHKLERMPKMKLSRMQDIGGCRAVLTSVEGVESLVGWYLAKSRMKHRLVRTDHYIDAPKDSGYRGVHLVYAYQGEKAAFEGLKIEIQIRSQLQHAWATAVETVGTFTEQLLKSSWGQEDWLRFFALMSSALALREGTTLVPGTPTDPDDLRKELRKYEKKLSVIQRLQAYNAVVRFAEEDMSEGKGQAYLLELDSATQQLYVRQYPNAATAAEAYGALELATEDESGKDIVLVNVESVAALKKAYPNYFLDTTAFVESLREAIA